MREGKYLLKVLRCFLEGTDPGAFDGNWAELLRLAHIHSVSGILGYTVMRFPNESNAPFAARSYRVANRVDHKISKQKR